MISDWGDSRSRLSRVPAAGGSFLLPVRRAIAGVQWLRTGFQNRVPRVRFPPSVLSGIHGYRHEQLTTGYLLQKPAVGQWPGRLIWVEEIGGSSPPSWTRRPQHASYRPSGRRKRLLWRKFAVYPAQGIGRPWLKWRECLPTKQEVAGSSPAGRAVSEVEAVEAPGCGPGGSGFESRRTPCSTTCSRSVRRTLAALAQLGEAPGLGPGGSGFESLGPHRQRPTPRFDDRPTGGRAHWRGGGTT